MPDAEARTGTTDFHRDANLKLPIRDLADDEISCAQNAGSKDMPRPRTHSPVTPGNKVLTEDAPAQSKLCDCWHLQRPAGIEVVEN
jgi:hypothetical protein